MARFKVIYNLIIADISIKLDGIIPHNYKVITKRIRNVEPYHSSGLDIIADIEILSDNDVVGYTVVSIRIYDDKHISLKLMEDSEIVDYDEKYSHQLVDDDFIIELLEYNGPDDEFYVNIIQ